MASILIVEDEAMIREIYSMIIDSEFDLEVVEADCGNHAIEILKDRTDFCCIISDYVMSNGSGGDLYQYVKSQSINIPFAIVSGGSKDGFEKIKSIEEDNPRNAKISKPFKMNDIVDFIKKCLPADDEALQEPTDYRPFNINHLAYMRLCPCDIYLNLATSKFVKIFHKGDEVDKSKLEGFLKKNISKVFIPSENFQDVINFSMKSLCKSLDRPRADQSIIDLQTQGVENLHLSMLEFGLSAQTIELTNKLVDSVKGQMKTKGRVKDMLAEILNGNGYRSVNAMTINYIAISIALKLEWVTEQTQEKICMAGLLHDLFLTDELAQIKNNKGKEFEAVTMSQQQLILSHTESAADLAKKFDPVSSDCSQLIFNHHEKIDGTGFPRGIGAASISPLCAVFNIAHDFSHELYQRGLDNKLEILKSMQERYSRLTFKKPFNCLVEILAK